MVFSVVAESSGSGRSHARNGRLLVGGDAPAIETPACLRYTRQGCVPHIVDATATLSLGQAPGSSPAPLALNVAFEHFVDLAIPRSQQRQKQQKRNQRQYKAAASGAEAAAATATESTSLEMPSVPDPLSKELHAYLALDRSSHLIITTPHDMDRITTPGSRWAPSTATAMSVVSNGNVECKLTPDAFAAIINALQPNIAVCLADPGLSMFRAPEAVAAEVAVVDTNNNHNQNASTPINTSENDTKTTSAVTKETSDKPKKSLRKRSERNLSYLTETMDRLSGVSLFANLCGELDPAERRFFSAEVIRRTTTSNNQTDATGDSNISNDNSPVRLAGVAMYAPAPTHGHDTVTECITASLEPLPKSMPALVLGLSDFRDIVAAIASGVDLIDDKWVYDLTNKGIALLASFKSPVVVEDHGLAASAVSTGESVHTDRPVKRTRRDNNAVESSAASATAAADTPIGSTPITRIHSHALLIDLRPAIVMKSRGGDRLSLTHDEPAAVVDTSPSTTTDTTQHGKQPKKTRTKPTDTSNTTTNNTTPTEKVDPRIINNLSPWRTDTRPISPQCGCWTCAVRPHSRAYIHHLLAVDDMLAYVLLSHHNIWQMDCLVRDMRGCIVDMSFDGIAHAILNE